ncbi:MAG: hypothetical protein CL820_08410 [Croceicoccus sp.]|nr:hypothetical protein [Idiomarinaceae bacterium]MAL25900.1 hypothetical protein [Croceicoccus sp.]|tara:strand:+ start:1613 stop:2011 length:399 start_codon:yes stop_codon:yes gene_type:complete
MKTRLAAIGIAFGALLYANSASADEYFERCVAQGSTSTDFAQCGAAWVEREEAALTQAWRRAYGSLSTQKAKSSLLAEQRLWISYKMASCKFYNTSEEFGSIGWSIQLPHCRAKVISDRVNQLNDYRRDIGE